MNKPQTAGLSDLAGQLAAREDVLSARLHHESGHDWRDPWLALAIETEADVLPAAVLALIGEAGCGIAEAHPPQLGQTHREVEIKADPSAVME